MTGRDKRFNQEQRDLRANEEIIRGYCQAFQCGEGCPAHGPCFAGGSRWSGPEPDAIKQRLVLDAFEAALPEAGTQQTRSAPRRIWGRQPAKSITEVELEARAAGLTYGKYLAGYRAERSLAKIADERERQRVERVKAARKPRGAQGGRPGRAVEEVDHEGHVLRRWSSGRAAARDLGLTCGSISSRCRNYERRVKEGLPLTSYGGRDLLRFAPQEG